MGTPEKRYSYFCYIRKITSSLFRNGRFTNLSDMRLAALPEREHMKNFYEAEGSITC